MHVEIVLESVDVKQAVREYVKSVYKIHSIQNKDVEMIWRDNNVGARINGDFSESELKYDNID